MGKDNNGGTSQLHSTSGTPLMNSIKEEEDPISPEYSFKTPYYTLENNRSQVDINISSNASNGNTTQHDMDARPYFASPTFSRPNSGFYSMKEGNDSSSSIIYNPSFSFGGSNNNTNNNNTTAGNNFDLTSNTPTTTTPSAFYYRNNNLSASNLNNNNPNSNPRDNRRNSSYKYIPGTKYGAPPSRNRSPVRPSSPDKNINSNLNTPNAVTNNNRDNCNATNTNNRSSLILESPFSFGTNSTNGIDLSNNLNTSHSKPLNFQSKTVHPPTTTTSRASFRKGHRYKHSSVSMNFFQEPEVKIPLNIAKSLPIPTFNDIWENLSWPKAHVQLFIVSLQIIICLLTYQLGHRKDWNNFITLSHFIIYDILGSIIIILVENLSQFEVWSRGTLTFPFGLNRIDVLLSFGSAVSLCFVGLDLVFHVIEESIVIFVESSNSHLKLDEHHEEIQQNIPHSHHSSNGNLSFNADNLSNMKIYYAVIFINLILANVSLYKTYMANTDSKFKTKNPLVTIAYTVYLVIFPLLGGGFISTISDYIATIIIAIFILVHGFTIAEWTSTILLNGFSTTKLTGFALLDPINNNHNTHYKSNYQHGMDNWDNTSKKKKYGKLIDSQNAELNKNMDENDVKQNKLIARQTSLNSLPISTLNDTNLQTSSMKSRFSKNKFNKVNFNKINDNNPHMIKTVIVEQIEQLTEFKSRCHLDHNNLIICKINFNLYIVLIKLTMKGGSNDDEIMLLSAIDKCIKRYLPSVETTIEIDRL